MENVIKMSKHGIAITREKMPAIKAEIREKSQSEQPLVLDFNGVKGLEIEAAKSLFDSFSMNPRKVIFVGTTPIVDVALSIGGRTVKQGVTATPLHETRQKRTSAFSPAFSRAFTIFLLLLTLGVGQMDAATRRYYCKCTQSWWTTSSAAIACYAWNDSGNNGWPGKKMTATGTSGEWYIDLDTKYTKVIFTRVNSAGDTYWSAKTGDLTLDENNYYTITSSSGVWDPSTVAGNWSKYAPTPAIAGSMNSWKPDANVFSGTSGSVTCSITLSANTVYEFKVITGTNWNGYGSNTGDLTYVGQSGNTTLSSNSGSNIRIATAGAGTYTFTYNTSSRALSVAYPEVTHPSSDYVYFKNTGSWANVKAHVFTEDAAVDVWPGPIISSFNFDGTNYYYAALGGKTSIIFSKSGDTSTKTGDLTTASSNKGKYYDYSSSTWKDFTATLSLDHQGPTNTPAPNSITVTYGASTNLTGDVITTSPAKTGYTFGGYYTSAGGGGSQLIGTNENVVASVSNYTDASTNWIRTGSSVSSTIYAKWTQSVTLDEQGATTSGTTSKSVIYNSASGLSTMITRPSKTGYDFGGYYTAVAGAGYQIIGTTGAWKASVSGYTDGDKKWIKPSGATTIYACWTQDVTLNANTSYHGSGSNKTATAVWNGTALTSFTATSGDTGYEVEGYYTYASGGTKVLNADGTFAADNVTSYITSGKWTKAGATTLYAHLRGKTYTVTLDKNEGDTDGSVKTTYNANTTSNFNAAGRAGYSCDGYFTAAEDGTKIINSDGTLVDATVSNWLSSGYWVKDAADITLYAQWTENLSNYTVTYGVKAAQSSLGSLSCATTTGSTPVSSGGEVVSGTNVTFTASPIAGYEVDAWYSDAACTERIEEAGYYTSTYSPTINENTTVYVTFKKKVYTITYSPSSAPTGCTYTTKPTTGTYGNTVTMRFTPSTGYTVSVSARDASSNVVTISNPSANTYTFTQPASAVTVTVSTSQIMSTLSTSCNYDAGDPKYSAPSKSVSSIGIATTSNITATAPGTGYTFAGWTLTHCVRTDANADDSRSITVRSDGSGSAASAVANYNEDLTSRWHLVGQNVASGVTYPDGWNVNSTSMMQKATGHSTESVVYGEVTVSNASNTYEFKVVDDNGASDDLWYGYSNGETYLTWTATATNTVYERNDGGDGNNANNLKFTPTVAGTYKFKVDYSGSNPAVTITYPTTYTLTYAIGSVAGTSGTISTSPSTASGSKVLSGTEITLTGPAAKSGYTWKGWYTNAAGTEGKIADEDRAITVTMNADKTLYACYTENDYTVTLQSSDATYGGTVASSSVTGHKDTKVTIPTATAMPGYYFENWTVATGTATIDDASSATAAKVYNMTANCTVQANFKPTWTIAGGDATADNDDALGDWNADRNTLWHTYVSSTVNYAYFDITTLLPNTDYWFKVVQRSTGDYVWWRAKADADTIINYGNSNTRLNIVGTDGNNFKIHTAATGTYTFDINLDDSYHPIKVHYPTSYTVTFGYGTGGSAVTASAASGGGSLTSGYYVASGSDITFTQTPATGYTFKGWYDAESSGSAIACMGTSDHVYDNIAGNIAVYAQYDPKTYTVTLDQQTDTVGYGGVSGSTSLTATYNAAFPSITKPTAANGWAFMGYYSEARGKGTQFTDASGNLLANVSSYSDASGHWIYDDDDLTLYAYYKKAEITALTLDATVVETNATVGVTPTISPTPTGDTKLCFYVFHSNNNPLDPQPRMTYEDGKLTFSAGETSGTYKIGVALRTGTECGGGTLLDSTTISYQVAGTHSVTVRYKCGDEVIKAATTLEGIRPLDWSDEISAPEITGYRFTGWTAGDGVSLTDDDGANTKTTTTEADIKIKAIYDGYLTANYAKKRVIYFNNTLGWDNVYVYFYKNDSYWGTGDDDKKGTGANTDYTFTSTPYSEGKHGQMEPIEEGSKIYYFDAEEAGVNASYTTVVFTELDQHGFGYFAKTDGVKNKVIRRTDYYSTKMPMYVPLAVQTPEAMNGNLADYYWQGYWMNYPENTGYTLKIYNKVSGDPAPVELKSIPFEFTADMTMPMELNVDLEAGKTYGFKIWRNDGLNAGAGSFYGNGGTMTANTEGWDMQTDKANCGLQTTAAGNYKFLLNFYEVSSDYQYRVSVTYPVATDDYRLLYKDNVQTKEFKSAIIPKASEKDTVSFFVRKGESPVLKLQKCTALGAGTITWTDTVENWWSSLPSAITKDSVYNICLKHNASTGKLEIENVEAYTGNYYIRVDAANSKWDNYRTDPDHLMTYSEYSITHGGYSHYYTHWVDASDSRKNVKFCIANDYSPSISDTLACETASGDWTNITYYVEDNGDLKRNANVRFMWNRHDNTISRAYVDGAQDEGSRFLVISSTDGKIKKADGSVLSNNEVTFSDDENWIYEANVKAQSGAQIKLKSTWGTENTIEQYFKGSSDATEALIGGSGDNWYDIRILYDFKTNRLIASYVPVDENIETDKVLEADIMFIREHQGDIAQLTFGENGKISKIETAYGVMRFNKWTLNNKDKSTHTPLASPASIYERSLFWISFPFKVKLSEVIGFGTYGVHWAIQRYDGESRAAKGHFLENGSFWKWMNRNTDYLEPDQGYLLAIDLDLLGESSDVWGPESRSDQIEIYFPSYGTMPDITNANVEQTIDAHACTINRAATEGLPDTGDPRTSYNRTIFDSHWNVMSVPTYVNTYNVSFTNTTWIASIGPNFLYTWNANDNTITATSASGYTYHAMHAYMVQYEGDITWSASSGSPASIVARRTYAEKPSKVEFRLELQQNEKMIDRTYVALSNDEEVSTGFKFGEDLTKEFNANKSCIYTFIADEATVAGNTLPMSNQTTIVPVGVDIKKNGDYTFSIPDGTSGIGVTLIDNETGIRTSLSALDYTVNLSAGTYDNRFVLEISPIKPVPTNVELVNGENGVRKMMIDGLLYIVKDGKMFDARGARVQ